ncbi:MAG: hypothetical protein AB7S77_21565, partial [Desulfatirhabdiaceae bacterium]
IPSYQAITHALYQSGIARPSGMENIETILESLKQQNVLRGGDVYYIAQDTNMLRDRFFSLFLKDIPPHPNLDFILCDTVRSELRNRKDKINRDMLQNMHPLNYGLMQSCFLNQNCLEDRLRYIGFQEYNRMRRCTSCDELDAASSEHSSAKNDQYILDAYSDFVGIGKKVVFLSRDNEAVRMMIGEENVIPVLLEHPPVDQDAFMTDWKPFFNLIFILGVLFGKLNLVAENNTCFALFGVWSSKDAPQWEEDTFWLEWSPVDGNSQTDKLIAPKWFSHLKRNIALLKKLKL